MAQFQYSLLPVFDRFENPRAMAAAAEANGVTPEQIEAMVASGILTPKAKKSRKPRRAPQNVADSQ